MSARSALLLIALLAPVTACRSRGGPSASPATSETPLACEIPAPSALAPSLESTSVVGRPLDPCSPELKTGWFRDGSCRTDTQDHGVHVVCAQVTDDFLQFSRSRGNDLITPHPEARFPGLRAGDRWCLCAERWREALDAGVAPPVLVGATHSKALRYVSQKALLDRAASR